MSFCLSALSGGKSMGEQHCSGFPDFFPKFQKSKNKWYMLATPKDYIFDMCHQKLHIKEDLVLYFLP